jgi:GRASP55/65 PDZ-like domain
VVYNIKSLETRLVTLIPSDTWGGAGLLGVTIRLDDYGGADERLIRVLSVEPQSPAAISGLVPQQDYLLGTVGSSLDDTQALANLLLLHVDQVIEFYVYNTNSDMVRIVPLMPTWSWGGRGLLGAEVATGYLHRLPHSSRATSGSSLARKVRYVQDNSAGEPNGNEVRSLEHEPQLELETEGGESGTMASPEDVSDMSKREMHKVETQNSGETSDETSQALKDALSDAAIIFSRPPPSEETDLR